MNKMFFLFLLLLTFSAHAIQIPQGFHQEQVPLNHVVLNVYVGGQGEPLLLIHGYAQSALMWSPLMKKLKNKFTIIAPDIRGAGESQVSPDGYDKMTMADDMKQLLEHYNISKTRVVGHDIGLMVAYALAAKYPSTVEKLVLMDAFIPGVGPGDQIFNDPHIWHFRFNGPYAEALVKGRERIYFDSLWDGFSAHPGSFPEEAKIYYLRQYSRPGRMHAGFEYFKAMPHDALVNREYAKNKLPMPLLAIGGDKANGAALAETAKVISSSPQIKIVSDCGHWMLEECPSDTIHTLEGFL